MAAVAAWPARVRVAGGRAGDVIMSEQIATVVAPRAFGARWLRRFRRDRDGATAVEFALISVPFLGLLFAIFETAFVFFATEAVEFAGSEASRQIMTGQTQTASITTEATFKSNVICPNSGRKLIPSFIDCTKLRVDARGAADFAAIDFSRPSTYKFCLGAPGDITVVRLFYPLPVYFSIIARMTDGSIGTITAGTEMDSGKRVHMLIGTSVFRTEPYSGWTGYASGC
jgi:Flp pilus assembly protein TadG